MAPPVNAMIMNAFGVVKAYPLYHAKKLS